MTGIRKVTSTITIVIPVMAMIVIMIMRMFSRKQSSAEGAPLSLAILVATRPREAQEDSAPTAAGGLEPSLHMRRALFPVSYKPSKGKPSK